MTVLLIDKGYFKLNRYSKEMAFPGCHVGFAEKAIHPN